MGHDLAPIDPQPIAHQQWNEQQIDLIRSQIAPDLNDGELALYLQVCNRTGLDPFARQVYAIKRAGQMTIQVSIDGFRLVAQRSRRYHGQTAPQWHNGTEWVDVWLSDDPPLAAKIGVYLKDAPHPTWGIATLREYAQTDRGGRLTPMWRSMPSTMLAKCAEALALRKAFPAELSGLYTTDEMAQAATPERVALSDDQRARLLALSDEAGVPAAAAAKRVASMDAAEFEVAEGRLLARIAEQEEAAAAAAVEADDTPDADEQQALAE